MKFPMYTVSLEELMKMEAVRPHERLMEEDVLVEFDTNMGNAAFISHQWISGEHPDPEFKQMRIMQEALKNMLSKMSVIEQNIPGQWFSPYVVLSTEIFHSSPLYFWYDYFSLPQIDVNSWDLESLHKPIDRAIESIPAYIASCEFFFALCPVVQNPDGSELFSSSTWWSRGWCRTEKTIRELSKNPSWIQIRSSTALEVVYGAAKTVIRGTPGEGAFGFNEDKQKIGFVLKAFLKNIIWSCLRSRDVGGYRMYLNLTNVLLSGFPIECQGCMSEMSGLAKPDAGYESLAEEFLDQNGFKHVNEVDSAGWSPLCYAAIHGDPFLIRSLLQQRADPCDQTRKFHPGLDLWEKFSVLSLACAFNHNEAAQVLIGARAQVDGGKYAALASAAYSNNKAAIRMLLEANADPERLSVGVLPIIHGCLRDSREAVSELMFQRRMSGVEDMNLSTCLHLAVCFQGGSADMVQQLIDAKADVNEQFRPPTFSFLGLLFLIHSWKFRLGRAAWPGKPIFVLV